MRYSSVTLSAASRTTVPGTDSRARPSAARVSGRHRSQNSKRCTTTSSTYITMKFQRYVHTTSR